MNVTITLPEDVATAILEAVVAHGHRIVRRASRKQLSEGGQGAHSMRLASAIIGDAIDAPQDKRFI